MIKILVLSAGDCTGINFTKSLSLLKEKYYIIATDTNVYRLQHVQSDEKYLLPDNSSSDDEYFNALLRVVHKSQPDFIYAADTNYELYMLSKYRDSLPSYCKYFLPSQAACEIYEDKWQTYQYLRSAGITVPETIIINTEKDIYDAIERFGKIWIRAISGSGGFGSIPTSDPQLGISWVRKYNGWGNFSAAEILTARTATWIGIWWNGELIVCQSRKRLYWEYGNLSPSGVTGITGAQVTCNDKDIHDIALRSILSTGHPPHGIVSVDFAYDGQGIPNPTEIQASRFYSSIYFLSKAGLNLPDKYVELGVTGHTLERGVVSPLPNDLLWLKAVDCSPILTSVNDLAEIRKTLVV
jgi:predicted ATP-grasp superfamily ATP-dependent carboligase